ncbi:MAG TPA: GDP-mannose 4,6-dehydratase, partial [Pirellulales bacterium]
QAEDYVIATGIKHSVRDLVELAFRHVGLDWREYVEVDQSLFRPADVNTLCGDASKARARLGWSPSLRFDELVAMMVEADLERVARSLAR